MPAINVVSSLCLALALADPRAFPSATAQFAAPIPKHDAQGGQAGGQIPRQRPLRSSVQGLVTDEHGLAVPAALVVLMRDGREVARTTGTADGVFRFLDLAPGDYFMTVSRDGYAPVTEGPVHVGDSELVTVDVRLTRSAAGPPAKPTVPVPPTPYGTLPQPKPPATGQSLPLPPGAKVFMPVPDRWNLSLPEWDRYGIDHDYPYVSGHWWDPYNQNRLKGDYPVLGKRTFFVFTGVSDSLLEGRNLPTASGVSTEGPGEESFFGRGGQYQPVTAARASFDLFRGDTAFRPVDWRVRVAPAFSVNFIDLSEVGIVNPDVRRGASRLDTHLGLQEAFVEKKLADLSPDYDFVSVRVGIQEFSSDFRGFIAVLEDPGVRLFGTLGSSRIEYNAAFFDLLEKDTNSGFNELHRRGQEVYVANLYVQDFLTPGYTTEFSFDANDDHGRLHYDTNGFLVRPAPIGVVGTDRVHAYYLGWAGSGHIGRLNVSHAFYQALGHETNNAIAAGPVTINAQLAALEISVDRDWLRFKGSTFYASGDADPSDDRARGFDAIVDLPAFAGGEFSLWNREGFPLGQTGTGLVSPMSLLPSLRTAKEEGQANFVNPGVWIGNGGVDAALTPKLHAFVSGSYLRFVNTSSLEALLFQPVRPGIGFDYGGGASYRPPLSDNIVLIGGVAAMRFGGGLQDIYQRRNVFSMFANLRLQF